MLEAICLYNFHEKISYILYEKVCFYIIAMATHREIGDSLKLFFFDDISPGSCFSTSRHHYLQQTDEISSNAL